MTQPITLAFSAFQVLVGDGATPETFSSPCGFVQRSLKLTATAGDTEIPDCDDEDAPVWTARDITGLSGSISGQGVSTIAATPMWRAWSLSGDGRNIRIGPANQTLANDGGFYTGSAVLSSYEVVAEKGKRCTVAVQIDSDGMWTWVPSNALMATVVPVISGTAKVSQTLTASQGTWTGSPTSYAYQWFRAGVAIVGATASTYTLVQADLNSRLTVNVTASSASASGIAISAATAPVAAADPVTGPSAPGGGPTNTADHSDPNNAYLLALLAA